MAEAHAALAYYYCNKAEIDKDIREDIRRSDELAKAGFGKVEKPVYVEQPALRGFNLSSKSGCDLRSRCAALDKAQKAGIIDFTTKRFLELTEKEVE